MIGRTISHYQIVGRLGGGGMGVVFRAIDTKLGRPVALKFLTAELAHDEQAVLRFDREARAASALNDPSICTVYETGEVDGEVFIAMELLEGETLQDRLRRGALPFELALEFALQLVDALCVAHDKGILHRDIKPANIFLVAGPRAKLLDFGLAKFENVSSDMETRIMLSSAGMVAGTEAYMSPEQALGKAVDARSDLFSFGLVVSEMLTGNRVFAGPRRAGHDGPPGRSLPLPSAGSRVPGLFDFIIEKALQERPEHRYQTAADLRVDLKRLKATAGTGGFDATSRHSRTWRRPVVVAALLFTLAAAAVAATFVLTGADEESVRPALADATFMQLTDRPGLEASASLAPDGTFVVYASKEPGNWDIFRKQLGHATAINLTRGSLDDDSDPSVAPDGHWVAFRSERDGGGIFVMDTAGGSVRRISNFCHNPAWSPDQRSIACATERIDRPGTRLGISPLWIIDVATGGKRQLTTTDGVQPTWSPDGTRIAYWTFAPSGIATVPAAGGEPVAVTQGKLLDWNPVWQWDGRHLLFASSRQGGSSNLWRVPVDQATGAVLGPVEPLTTPSSDAGFISVSRDGTRLAYVDQSFARNFSRLRLDRPADPPVAVTRGAHVYGQPDVSPDGRRLAYYSQSKVFVMNVDGTGVHLLTDSGDSRGPRWSPDGSRIAFYSNRTGTGQIWTANPDGSDLAQLTDFKDTKGVYYPVWSPDGKAMTSTSHEGLNLTVDLTVPLSARKPKVLPPLPTGNGHFVAWQWSADGTRLAGWKLMPDGRPGGLVIYEAGTASYRELTTSGTFPTWIERDTALLFTASDELRVITLASSAVTALATPPGFATHFALSRDQRSLYFAEDLREGDVWLISWPSPSPKERQ